MKPVKNHYFCIGAYRTKMLFKEKHNADNFIRFNAEEIYEQSGKAPVRSYYCQFCGGWHVTSVISPEEGKKRDELDENRFFMLMKMQTDRKKSKKTSKIQEKVESDIMETTTIKKISRIEAIFLRLEEWMEKLVNCGANEYMTILEEYKSSKTSYDNYCQTLEQSDRLNQLKKRMKFRMKLKHSEFIYSACFGLKDSFSWLELCDKIENCDSLKDLNLIKCTVDSVRTNVESLNGRLCLDTLKILRSGVSRFQAKCGEAQKRLMCRMVEQNPEWYRTRLLALIDTLEHVRHCYGEGRFEDALKMVSDGLTELKGFYEDKNVSILKRHFMKWYRFANDRLKEQEVVDCVA